ncbi:ALP1-like protein [Tanacetum coccineum]|uniref:ALP1-like protein n=1 Tax=Tanacetum coccineum TaxID=301880 RepID=A0ABQ5H639_9ASTR
MKCTTAIRQLAYDNTPDAFDEYLQMSERTAHDCLLHFNKCIIDLYMSKYLRKLTLEDVEKIYNQHVTGHAFSGMLGSIDCMHWEWKNCPVSWQGQYGRGDNKYPTIMLEAVASHDLWIWHAFFVVVGANNDINVLDNSPLFDDFLDDKAPVAPFVVNGVGFEKRYYLADGIYPQWVTFVKSFTVANDAKHSYFKKRQESARKDVERAFGVLQGRWGIIQQPARQYHVNNIRRIMYSCIILHNMILEDQKWRLLTGTICMLIRQEICNVHGLKDVKHTVEKQKNYETEKRILVFNITLWSIFGMKLNTKTKMKTFSRRGKDQKSMTWLDNPLGSWIVKAAINSDLGVAARHRVCSHAAFDAALSAPTVALIKNGNKVLKKTVGDVEQVYEPTSAEEKLDMKNEMKARGCNTPKIWSQRNGNNEVLLHSPYTQVTKNDLKMDVLNKVSHSI